MNITTKFDRLHILLLISTLFLAFLITTNKPQTNQTDSKSSSEPELDILPTVLSEPESPLVYDANLNEYSLITTNEKYVRKTPIKYNPWTGKLLPETKRKKAPPSIVVTNSILETLSDSPNAAELIQKLGPPASIVTNTDFFSIQLIYTNIIQESKIVFQFDQSSNLNIFILP